MLLLLVVEVVVVVAWVSRAPVERRVGGEEGGTEGGREGGTGMLLLVGGPFEGTL